MGICAPLSSKKYRISTSITDSKPSIRFNVTKWSKNTKVNFRDNSTCDNQTFTIMLQQQQNHILHDFTKQNKQIHPSISNNKNTNLIKCNVKRKKSSYQMTFDSTDIYRSAIQWLEITQNDVCLIGRTKYRFIKFIETNNYKQNQIRSTQNIPLSSISLEQIQTKCRICYSTRYTQQNPLVNPCNCKGSIEFIHLKCLSHWLFGEVDYHQLLHLQTKKSICQICKTNITQTMVYRNIIGNILSGNHNIPPPFVIFQGTINTQNMQNYKTYMILSFATKKQFKIGRSRLADITDNLDLFVSRINSIIAFRDNKIWIKDGQSKHGTSIEIQSKIILSNENYVENLIYRNMSIKIQYFQQ